MEPARRRAMWLAILMLGGGILYLSAPEKLRGAASGGGCQPGETVPELDIVDLDLEVPLELAAEAVLIQHCAPCHGNDGSNSGGVDYILDVPRLLDSSVVIAGDPASSRLYSRIAEDTMPPQGVEPRPDAVELATLRLWTEAGAEDFDPVVEPVEFISLDQTIAAMADDVVTLDEKSRQNARYISLVHLANQGLSAEIANYVAAITLLVNSLSWEEELAPAVAINDTGTILRIDISDYGWIDKDEDIDVWQDFEDVYPYPVLRAGAEFSKLAEATGTELPFLNGDWLLAFASQAPLYNLALQLPTNLEALEEQLGVDRLDNITSGRAARSGFNGSGVSQHNRLIERHETDYGAYWISYDFASSTGQGNLFSHPLDFAEDGGEMIWNLPNGLQAYMISDAQGTRIDDAPTAVVTDNNRPDRTVTNGLSCFGCHGAVGIIKKDDQLRPHVEQNEASFDVKTVERVKALHPTREEFSTLQDSDITHWGEIMTELRAPEAGVTLVMSLTQQFERDLTLEEAASEIGMTGETFMGALAGAEASRLLEFRTFNIAGGTMKRDVFLDLLPELSCHLLGVYSSDNGVSVGAMVRNLCKG